MQLNGLAMLARNAGDAEDSRKITVAASGASIALMRAKTDCRTETTPAGGLRMRSKLALTSAEVSGDPSWKVMPGRILNVVVSLSSDVVQLSATSGATLEVSFGSMTISSE